MLAAGLALPAVGQTGTYSVTGRVTDGVQGGLIAQATVTLGDSARVLTNLNGEFVIRGVRPGRYPLTVEALGYEPARTTIVVNEDVTGTVELQPQPIRLDTLGVQPARFALRGRVLDQETGRSVSYVTIQVPGYGETSSNDAGGFRIGDLARGRYPLVVEGFGWLPLRLDVELESDTTLIARVARDPITERIIDRQEERLAERVRSIGSRVRAIAREEILESRAATPSDIVAGSVTGRIVTCPGSLRLSCIDLGRGAVEPYVYIDDRLTQCGLEVLRAYPNASIHRIEVFRNASTIRAYTTWFIERMNAGHVLEVIGGPAPRRFRC